MPNHPALIDPIILYSQLAGLAPRPLVDEAQLRGPVRQQIAEFVRAVTIPDMTIAGRSGSDGVNKGMKDIIQGVKQGDNILVYPSGRIYRSAQESLRGNSAAAQILAEVPEARVLLVRSKGLWGSSFSRASGSHPRFLKTLWKGLLSLPGNLFFLAPRREVEITVVEAKDLPRHADKMTLNRYLEDFYNQAETPPVFVPRYFWRKETPFFPAPPSASASISGPAPGEPAWGEAGQNSNPARFSREMTDKVFALLREHAGLGPEKPLDPGMKLGADLYMDSLAAMELSAALEQEFGHSISSPEALGTVGDCLLAASGELSASPEGADQTRAPQAWFAPDDDDEAPLDLAGGASSCVDAFFQNAAAAPKRPLTADRTGLRTRKELLVGVLALARQIAPLPGERLGIMLPAVPAALVFWLAALYAGKTPVFINWTVGRRNLEHCLALCGIRHAITASALLEQLRKNGTDLDGLPVTWLPAESLGKKLTALDKLRAFAQASLHCSPLPYTLKGDAVPSTAAVLFTSGSEARPKAVPLSHSNVMTNAADVLTVLRVQRKDKLLAMLPPFHSFGLLVGLVLPAASGVRTAYHANPTESERLCAMVRDFGLTVFGATPTFLEALLAKAHRGNPLATLRYAFAGAEKCPKHVYDHFAAVCPQAALCEGYGITECSPVVSVNRPDATVEGSIGHVLPSVSALPVVEEEAAQSTGEYLARRANTGESGMLLVRGPSIFSGYLAAGSESPASPFVSFEGKEWYRTGDLVTLDETGRLFFKGRLKRFVKIGGEMISLPQMEDVLQQAFGVHPDLLGDGKPFLAVEATPGSEEKGQAELCAYTTLPLTTEKINAALRDAGLSSLYSVKRAVRLAQIPVLGTGKVDYRSLHACAQNDE
ncbi:AMP-binding protein [Desulfovibrio sp. OttesenSCG-928-G15]|nr:AMP-binding protein [Desulfovibrio sp. OttesenSCG-928-G15]